MDGSNSKKFKRIGKRFKIKTVFKTKYILGNFLQKTKPDSGAMDKASEFIEFRVSVAGNTLVKLGDL